jgi:Response regulator containing a CheY-like receiver domain and an HTH DNA-binding domain
MPPISLLVVDDHPLVIEGVRSLLSGQSEVQLVGQAQSLSEARAFLEKHASDIQVVLLDIRLQDGLGIDLAREIRQKYPHIQVIALTMYDSEAYLEAIIKAGARGYLLKNTSRDELVKAIKAVLEGRYYFSEGIHDTIGQRLSSEKAVTTAVPVSADTSKSIRLTKRERQILELVAKELNNVQIAAQLNLSPRTVHTHRRAIMQKLGVRNTAGLIRQAIELGLLPGKQDHAGNNHTD